MLLEPNHTIISSASRLAECRSKLALSQSAANHKEAECESLRQAHEQVELQLAGLQSTQSVMHSKLRCLLAPATLLSPASPPLSVLYNRDVIYKHQSWQKSMSASSIALMAQEPSC